MMAFGAYFCSGRRPSPKEIRPDTFDGIASATLSERLEAHGIAEWRPSAFAHCRNI